MDVLEFFLVLKYRKYTFCLSDITWPLGPSHSGPSLLRTGYFSQSSGSPSSGPVPNTRIRVIYILNIAGATRVEGEFRDGLELKVGLWTWIQEKTIR